MENWGLIVYREDLFLLDEHKASYLDRINAALTISHEIAHNVSIAIEPRSEKTGLRGFRSGPTQTRLYSH